MYVIICILCTYIGMYLPYIHIIIVPCIPLYMGGSRKNFRGGEPNIVGIKVAQLNVLLALQLRISLVISELPV